MAVNKYFRRTILRIAANFKDEASADIDPTTVTFSYISPPNTPATITALVFGIDSEVVKDNVGDYHVDLDLNQEGIWRYRWEGLGTGQIAAEAMLEVLQSSFEV